jgi:hypothetical protein
MIVQHAGCALVAVVSSLFLFVGVGESVLPELSFAMHV